jgi:hypothetical protein
VKRLGTLLKKNISDVLPKMNGGLGFDVKDTPLASRDYILLRICNQNVY